MESEDLNKLSYTAYSYIELLKIRKHSEIQVGTFGLHIFQKLNYEQFSDLFMPELLFEYTVYVNLYINKGTFAQFITTIS